MQFISLEMGVELGSLRPERDNVLHIVIPCYDKESHDSEMSLQWADPVSGKGMTFLWVLPFHNATFSRKTIIFALQIKKIPFINISLIL